VQVPDTGDEMGDPEPDTSAPISPDSDGTPATPQPVSPSGPLPAGSYSTELWTSDETGPDDGTNVVSSTASGTSALTGVVMDANSDALVPGATVRMASSTASTTTTSDASGAYAFANMPAGTYTVTISAPGYGSYTLLNSAFAGDQYYELTTTLDTSAQTFDEAAQGASAQTSASPYPFTLVYSPTRTPPSVRVGIYPLNSDCSRAGSSYSVVNLPWVYYLLRVADAEVIGNHYNQVGQKAFFSLAQNFGWYHKLSGGVWDVDNSTVTQCYRNPPRYKIPGTWKSWINDVLDERVTDSTSRLVQTQYNAGTSPPKCPDPSYPQHGQYASQNTINILSENGNANAGCAKRTDWRDIVRYWYPNSPVVQLVYRPPIPVASATFPGDGHIHFHFTARQYSANTAWYFAVRVKTSSGWSPIGKKIGWAWRTRGSGDCIISGHSVGTCLDYFPPDTACHRYEVVAHNPRGDSLPAQFTKKGIGYNRSGTCNLT
jgi:hypothetical protein